MANVLVDGLNSKAGGGKSIFSDYLTFLREQKANDQFFILTPNKNEYLTYSCEWIQIVDIMQWHRSSMLIPIINQFVLPRLIRRLRIDAIVNFSDVVIPTDVRQLYLFDWPYAVYPESVIWERMDWRSFIKRKVKAFCFRQYIKHASLVAVQSETMRRRLTGLYGLETVEIIPNAVPRENLRGGEPRDFSLPSDRPKLLYLTHYYPHKNLEVFLPLARRIKHLSLPYCIIVTISEDQHQGAKCFLRTVKKEGLNDTIINVGPVPMSHVPSLYAQCDALLMPTLLESYGLTYIEAMHHRLPVLTSDLDFAVDVCGDSAYYFDPLDAGSILDAIQLAFHDVKRRQAKMAEGEKRLGELPEWRQVFNRYHELLGVGAK